MRNKYFTEEERLAAKREKNRRYYQNNKEKILERHADYYQNNKEKIAEYNQNNKDKIAEYQAEYYRNNKEKKAAYRKTPIGRAETLINSYKQVDKKYNRGECTLTADWIVEHIFTQPCHYCGKTGWKKMGCDRKDSSLPHVPDNVVPCCYHCNCKKHTTSYDEFMKQIGKVI